MRHAEVGGLNQHGGLVRVPIAVLGLAEPHVLSECLGTWRRGGLVSFTGSIALGSAPLFSSLTVLNVVNVLWLSPRSHSGRCFTRKGERVAGDF